MQKNNFDNHQIPLNSSESSQNFEEKKWKKYGFLSKPVELRCAGSE